MSRKYKFKNPEGIYFISFATVSWVDVFTRSIYKDIVVESLKYRQKEKGLILFAWVIMSNHIHLIAKAKEGHLLQHIMRDLKKFTSKQIVKAIEETHSRRDLQSRRIFNNHNQSKHLKCDIITNNFSSITYF